MRLSSSMTMLVLCGAGFLWNCAHAAQDYNSSRSNNSSSIAEAPDEVDKMLELSKADALSVAHKMIEIDKREGYSGAYEIKVNVSVSVERAPKNQGVGLR